MLQDPEPRQGALGIEANRALNILSGTLQGKMLTSAAGLSPLTLQVIEGMAAATKTDAKKITDALQGQAGPADAQKRSASGLLSAAVLCRLHRFGLAQLMVLAPCNNGIFKGILHCAFKSRPCMSLQISSAGTN